MRQHPLACRGVRPVKLMTEVANQRRGHGGEMRKSALIAALLGGGLPCVPVRADEPLPVIVTAERHDSEIQLTPVAVSLLPAGNLDRFFTNDLTGLNGIVPGLQLTRTAGFENIATIRGVGSQTPEEAPVTVAGVALFVDDVYISNTISLNQTLFDVDRIEVLRGPQGALYGQSSPGGAILVKSRQPEFGVMSGSMDLSAGSYNLTRERLGINIPIGETLAVRISGQRFDHDGFTRNAAIAGFRQDDAHDTNARIALAWKPSERFSVNASAQWYHAGNHGPAQKNILDPEPDPRSIYQDYPSNFELTTALHRLVLEYELPWVSINSTTALQNLKNVQREDASRSAFVLTHSYDDVAAWNNSVHDFSEELDFRSPRGSQLEWTAGGLFLRQRFRQFIAEFQGHEATPDLTIRPDIERVPPQNLAYGNDLAALRKSYSLFTQLTWHATRRLRLTAGGRLNDDTHFRDSVNFSAFAISRAHHSSQSRVPTFRAEVGLEMTPQEMAYFSVARGYKPGGINGSHGQAVIAPTFEPEINTAFEAGFKLQNSERSNSLRVAAFYSNYRNMQYIEQDPVPFDYGISNIPTLHIYGLETEGAWSGMDGHLSLKGNLSLQDGKVQGHLSILDSTVTNTIENAPRPSPCASGGAYFSHKCWASVIAAARPVDGNSPPATPKISGSLTAAYRIDVNGGTVIPAAQYVYRGSEWARIFHEPDLDYVPAYGIFNLSVQYINARPSLTLALVCSNAFDRAGVNSRFTDPFTTGQTSEQYIPPRQATFTVGYSF